jgi:hypothetical protein
MKQMVTKRKRSFNSEHKHIYLSAGVGPDRRE